MRRAFAAVLIAAAGAGAALGIGSAAGLLGGSTTETVVVRPSAEGTNTPARVVIAGSASGFSPARIFAERSPGVVTVFAYFSGSGAQGSGFVISRDGTILTNAHVVTNAGEGTPVRKAGSVYVEFADHDRVPATVVGWDVFDDVAVLRVEPARHHLQPLPLGRSASLVVGEPVAAIGSPLGNEDSIAVGIVSAVDRSIAALTAKFQLVDAIQTDAPIAHGSSGGPLLDGRGRVIGINAQIRSDSGGPAGIGFAVPIDAVKRSLRQLLATGHVAYAYAGIQTEDLTPSLAHRLGLSTPFGALVDAVNGGGPAEKAGIQGGKGHIAFEGQTVVTGGDVVVAVNGAPVRSADDLVRIVTNTLEPDRTAVFTVVRAGQRQSIAVRLVAR
ncbi:MAG TPA: trypsin-like peptidase domain-containing protein [Gaiellaceae bacterium]|nr:trypsin-like peptidase domain-containing protein [Gaiellaceae bacterium]